MKNTNIKRQSSTTGRCNLIKVLLVLLFAGIGTASYANYFISGDSEIGLMSNDKYYDMGSSSPYTAVITTTAGADKSGWIKIWKSNEVSDLLNINGGSNISGTGEFDIDTSAAGSQISLTDLEGSTTYTITVNTSTNKITISSGGGGGGEATYSLLMSNNNNKPSLMESKGSVSSANMFSWEVELPANTNNNYFALSTSSSYTDMYPNSSSYNRNDIINKSSKVSNYNTQHYNFSSKDYYFYYFYLASAQSTKLIISYNKSTNKYTLSDVADPPVVYMGKQPSVEGNMLTGKVFLAQTGGATVNSIRVYYEKDKDPNPSTSPYVECSGSSFSCGNQYPYQIEQICEYGDGDYRLMAVASNGAQTGESDIISYNGYTCCPGSITRFQVFQSRTYALPGDGEVDFTTSITGGGAEPVYKWEFKVGESGEYEVYPNETSSSIKYPIPLEDGGTKIYVRVTATGSNCGTIEDPDQKIRYAELTLCTVPTVSISADLSSITPWKEVTLSAEIHDATSYQWSCSPEALLTETSNTGAKFKAAAGPASDDYNYTIYLSASERHCGSVETATKRIMVIPDNDGCE